MPHSTWACQTGQDFTNHTLIKDIDFGGMHVWPDNWDMCAAHLLPLLLRQGQTASVS